MIREQPRSLQILVGLLAVAASVTSVAVGFLFSSNLKGSLLLTAVGLMFLSLSAFFATVGYRLIRNVRRKDGGLLPRSVILVGSLLFSAYFLAYLVFSDDLSAFPLTLAVLGVPLFVWIGVRAFRHRGRRVHET